MDCTEKMYGTELGFREYVEALEVERQKIKVFQRELPLCFEIVTQTIERCKQQISSGATATTEYLHGHQSEECNSEQTSSEARHVFEEFIPLKRSFSNSEIRNNNNNNNRNDDVDDDHDGDEDEQELDSPAGKSTQKDNMVIDSKNKKEDWLRSVQLWNDPTPDPPPKQELAKKASVTEVKRNNGGAFQPFQKENNARENHDASSPETVAATTTTTTEEPASAPAASSTAEQKDGQRKQRRNWSPELHKRFLNALQQLGGSHAATPKQIRELMKVDGLTNDEVKSHLQKYRLHTRRPAQGITNNGGNGQTAQVVFVGGIWVQPPEYTVAEATRIYAPVAAPLAVHHNKHNSDTSDDRLCRTSQHSNSPATSSSTHTTTTSHAF